MPKVEVNGIQLDYQINGSGPHLLQIPGAVLGKEAYAAITPVMADAFTVIDYDHRGYGGSDRPQQKYTIDVWVEDMVGLVDALGIDRTHVHGGSMGSTLALHYAARHPDRVRGLVLSGCTAKSDNMAKAHYAVWKALARAGGMASEALAYEFCAKGVSRAFFDGPTGGIGLVRALQEAAGRNVSVDVFCDACDVLADVDVTAELAAVTAPTLVVVGDEDVLTPADQGLLGAGGRFIYEHLTAAAFKEFVVIPGSGHANLLDNPELSNRVVIDFLRRVDAG
jgi:pimeloyl-ACP methyl ester carboxylesterase